MKPEISVVVVSDYAADTTESETTLAETISALAAQQDPGPVEYIFCESTGLAGCHSKSLLEPLDNARILAVEANTSYELKNAGVAAAIGDIVAILDADCRPCSGWLRAIRESIQRHPNATVVSGRTRYEGKTRFERIAALTGRSYLDPGRRGRTRFISNNNAAWKREQYLRYPMPVGLGAFASRMQSESVWLAGGEMQFEPDMLVVHESAGLKLEADIRRNIGYGTIITRLVDQRMPHAGLIRLGRGTIPFVIGAKMLLTFQDCLRCAALYGVRRFEIPLALAWAVAAHCLEAPGMWQAYAGAQAGPAVTAYR